MSDLTPWLEARRRLRGKLWPVQFMVELFYLRRVGCPIRYAVPIAWSNYRWRRQR